MRPREPGQRAAALDLRLVPAALLSWLVVLLGLGIAWSVAALVAALAAVVASYALLARRLGRFRDAVLAPAACATAVGIVVAVHGYQLEHHPLRGAAERGSAATLRVVLTGDPVPVLTPESVGYAGRDSGATQVSIPARLRTASVAGGRWALGGQVVLLAPRVGWDALVPGVELTVSGLLAPATRPDLTVAILRVRGSPGEPTAPPWWQRIADLCRSGLSEAARAVLPERQAPLLSGLAIGDTSAMSWILREEFRATGLVHLTAVSGANVLIVCGAVFGILALPRAGPKTRVIVALLALVGFVVLARPSPSVLRAAVMGAIGLLAVLVGRRRPVVPALAAAVIGLLLIDPELGTDPGFALSVMATGALILLAPPWAAWLREHGFPPGVAEALAVPTAAHVVTAPLVAGISGQVSLIAVVTNLLVAPVVAPITVLGVLAALVSPVSQQAAELCAWLAGPAVGWLAGVAHWGADIPGGTVVWPAGVGGALLLAALLFAGVLLVRRRRVRALVLAVVVGAILVLLPTRLLRSGWPAHGWFAVACDVGQGDAVVLATGQSGSAVLVDAGTEVGAVDGCLSRLGVTVLPLVVISHLHADHMGGLRSALDGRSVGAVAVGSAREPAWAYERVRRIAGERRVPVLELRPGQRLSWPSLVLEVLGPSEPIGPVDPEDGTDVNNTSVVLRADTVGGALLLTGDIELLAQARLLGEGAQLRADVLKLPHHGSRYTSPEFLAAVSPRLVLVSVGAGNRYGHPNDALLNALRQRGALVRRTDESGDVAVVATPNGPAAVARGSPLPSPRRDKPG